MGSDQAAAGGGAEVDSRSTSPFRTDVEGLRGVAVLLVVAFHVGWPGFGGGFIGVDVFFVLSGYLITALLVREAERDGKIRLGAFYTRRARRLLPAAFTMLVCVMVTGMLLLSPLEQGSVARTAVAAAVYVSNLWQIRTATDYFAAGESDPLLHMWSLSVEEQFYLAWPVLLMLTVGSGRRYARSFLTLIVVASFVRSLWLVGADPVYGFFAPDSRAWQFGAGGLLALWAPTSPRWSKAASARHVRLMGLCTLALSAVLIGRGNGYPGWVAVIPTIATVTILAVGSARNEAGLLDSAALGWIGQRSYSWYLWHWPLIVITAQLLPDAGLAAKVCAALLALGLAHLSLGFVEEPIRRERRLVLGRRGSLIGAAVASLLLSGMMLGWMALSTRLGSSPAQARLRAAAADRPSVYRDQCVPSYPEAELRSCVAGEGDTAPLVILFGDSHAAQWFPALQQVAARQGWRVLTFLKAGCPTADVEVGNAEIGWSGEACASWRRAAIDRIKAELPTAVVMSNFHSYVVDTAYRGFFGVVDPGEWRRGLRGTLESFAAHHIPVLLLRDTPTPGVNVPRCLSRAVHVRWIARVRCDTHPRDALRPNVFAAEEAAAAGIDLVRVLDLTARFCDTVCPADQDGIVRYSDNNHISATMAASLAPEIGAALEDLRQGRPGLPGLSGVMSGSATP